jgi:Flp pilus assembly secretin CpaC
LELEAEFKLLAGESVNGIPLLSNRRVASKVRLRQGEWAAVAGLMSASEARTIRGVAGLARLPALGLLFRQQQIARDSDEVLILLKPRIVALPPSEQATATIWVGSEGRPKAPL